MDTCQVCLKECKARRCTKCRQAYYCSVSCQSKDWKAGHRRVCRSQCTSTRKEKADWALQQLGMLNENLSPEGMKERHDKASDEVKRRQQESRKAPKSRMPESSAHLQTGETSVLSGEPQANISQVQKSQLNFDVVVEDMKYISRFQMTLKRRNNSLITTVDLSKAQVNFKMSSPPSTRTSIEISIDGDHLIYSTTFPRLVDENSARCQLVNDDILQISVTYKDDPTLRELGTREVLISTEEVNQIQCSSCQTSLLSEKPIVRTSELPAGHWDDIADYLICYSGQPFVDFTIATITAEPSVALQDGNFLCLNYADLTSTVSVQPVPGYGDIEGCESTTSEDRKSMDLLMDPAATVRGERHWRDVTGGATVCCNHCSKAIGFASMEAPECFRLLKHRLSIPRNIPGKPSSLRRLSSCASFLAREMVRYAEAKAIFTFIVTLEAPHMSFASTVFTRCILLRLVSWDCNLATSADGEDSNELCFQRYAKLVFEETYDKRAKGAGEWIWGGIDLCCPPLNIDEEVETVDEAEVKKDEPLPGAQRVSSTRIQLCEDEYTETLKSMVQGRKFFTKNVADATILMKMGRIPDQADEIAYGGLGLTAIPLYL